MSGDHNQYQKPDKCARCGEVSPAHTCTPKQSEPVAIVTSDFDGGNKSIKFLNDVAYMNLMQKTLLYTAPPQREWQGLTDEEIREFEIWLDDEEEKHGWNLPADIVKYIEAKLKEKNGGRKYITHEPAPQRQPEPVGWIYEDDEGRMIFSQMPHPDPLWEPVYRAQK